MDSATEALTCGLNGRGTQSRICEAGKWSTPTTCEDPDVCVDSATEALTCGLNGRGTQSRSCEAGKWSAPGPCTDPDVCVDGASDSLVCGLNGRGTQIRTCDSGAWTSSACMDADVCTDEAVETRHCGVLGRQSRECKTGQWGDYDGCDAPASLSLQVAGRKDMVHDARRNLLYITTSGANGSGQVRVYNLVTRQFESPLLTGGSFFGIDLSPDGNGLLVADVDSNETKNWIHQIDLTTGESKKIEFSLDFYEGGTFTAVYTSDTEALVSSTFKGSGWVPLRKVNLTDGTAKSIKSVRQSTMLTASADGSTVAYAESNISSGSWGRFNVDAQTFAGSGTGWFVYEIAVSRQASQYAVPTYGGLFIYDGALKPHTTLGKYADTLPIGAVYSPIADELYLAWYSFNRRAPSIDVYSATTLTKLRDIELATGLFDWTGNGAFGNGRMRTSRDGRLLFATSGTDRVVIYPTGL
ncbi:hypothetical protein JYK02_24455 [Corallococcus macrosporus]|uniref:Uncharacterized protein n=1 Tax=Corallococcus macrosporus TaxID=35 RepID=A0ABS3DH84_9BACT|nr:hypothetical protein [Corallococcus macrosporus]MBN8230670.1 hypothetical protein [Corallococcus macrosporus]